MSCSVSLALPEEGVERAAGTLPRSSFIAERAGQGGVLTLVQDAARPLRGSPGCFMALRATRTLDSE